MKTYLVAYTTAVIAFIIIDGLWLGLIARNFYATHLDHLLRKQFLLLPGAAFYLIYTAGLVFLAVRPMQPDLSLANVALYGAIVGFMSYGTYDMTNLATLRDWPLVVSLVDVAWGTVLSALVVTVSAMGVRYLT